MRKCMHTMRWRSYLGVSDKGEVVERISTLGVCYSYMSALSKCAIGDHAWIGTHHSQRQMIDREKAKPASESVTNA